MQAYWQNVRENLLLALDTLRGHKFRSFLTILGVAIGVLVVILVASIIAGLNRQVVDMANDFGTNTLWVYKFDPGLHGRPTAEERMRKPLTFEDAMAIREQCPSAEAVAVELFQWAMATAKYKGQEMVGITFEGATPEVFSLSNSELDDGRLFNEIDDLHRRNVAVVGAEIKEMFFQHEDPIGKVIEVNGHTFEIIGAVSKRKQAIMDMGMDRIVFIPYLTYKKFYPQVRENFISVSTAPGKLNQVKDEVTGVLRRRRGVKPSEKDNFGIGSSESMINDFREMTNTIGLLVIALSSIGLLVGGIGVMNIMLVSVTERTREIGVRKAIGARRSDITWQFLLEAMILTALGGTIGISVAYLSSYLIRTYVAGLPSTVPVWSVAAGLMVSVSIGLFFGMWPALRAARLDPIVALRHE
jgi:ABC-type antimicrobial peptide transport system permease subunit